MSLNVRNTKLKNHNNFLKNKKLGHCYGGFFYALFMDFYNVSNLSCNKQIPTSTPKKDYFIESLFKRLGAKGIDFVSLNRTGAHKRCLTPYSVWLALVVELPFSGAQIPTSTQKKDYFAVVFLIGGR